MRQNTDVAEQKHDKPTVELEVNDYTVRGFLPLTLMFAFLRKNARGWMPVVHT